MLLGSKICHSWGLGNAGLACESTSQALDVKVEILDVPKESPRLKEELDLLSCAFVSIGVLKQLQAISGSWVIFETSKGRKAVLRIVEAPQVQDENSVYICPMLAFNLSLVKDDCIKVARRYYVQDSPGVSAKVTIARVRSPESSGHAEYGQALRDFFKIPRVLRKMDIIAIPIEMEMKLYGCGDDASSEIDDEEIEISGDFEQDEEQEGIHQYGFDEEAETKIVSDRFMSNDGQKLPIPCRVVFFQVTELLRSDGDQLEEADEEGMIIDGVGGETMLAQVGAVNTRVPDPDVVLRYYQLDGGVGTVATSPEEDLEDADQLPNTISLDVTNKSQADNELLRLLQVASNPRHLSKLRRFGILLYGGKSTGKRHMIEKAARKFGLHVFEESLTPLRGLPEERAAKKLKHILQQGTQVSPCIIHLRHIQALTPVPSGSEQPTDPEQLVEILKSFSSKNAILVASTQSVEDIPAVIRGCFTHEIGIEAPSKSGRLAILEFLTANRISLADDVSLESLATRTAGRTAMELKALFAEAACILLQRQPKVPTAQSSAMEDAWRNITNNVTSDLSGQDDLPPLVLTQDILSEALEGLPSASAMDIGAPKIPQVYWKDVGGLGHAKDEILDMVQLPLQHPELFASGVRQRSGILLYGPPGTGKTLLAKAVATECNLNFISVKGPELLDMYIGESERKVRQVFETARSAKPCVLFFDELDSLAPQRGRGADSGGVMDRVVSQLLTEIDGMQGNTDVFVIGATNRPDLLDQSLLRPGRFDRLIYLGICRDRDAQLKIVKALSRKFIHDDNVVLEEVLDRCPFNFTGADFYALCSGAMANALQRRVKEIQDYIAAQGDPTLTARKLLSTMDEEDLQVTVKMCDYHESLATTSPSVSEDEIKHYESLRAKFSSGSDNKSKQTPTDTTARDAIDEHEDVRACPVCNTPTVKDGGCDKVTCAVCQHEYSWTV